MKFLKSVAERIKWEAQIFVELHQEEEFRKQMILPYISLIIAIIALVITFLPRPA